MTPDIAIAAAERTEAAQRLIDRAQHDEVVHLEVVSALELCVLGGPKHPLFEEDIAYAWLQMGNRRRRKIIQLITEGMIERGLLTEDHPGTSPRQGAPTYSLTPALGIALAARCRPAFIVITDAALSSIRTGRMFALGDQDEPVRAIVVEDPAALPAEYASNPQVKKFGPLSQIYNYVLASPGKAAEGLAEWAIAPPPQRPGVDENSACMVSRYHPQDGHISVGIRLIIRSDGTTARVDRPRIRGGHGAAAEYDLAGLRAVMLDLLTMRPR